MPQNPHYAARNITCAICKARFVDDHPRRKYCSPECAAEGVKRVRKPRDKAKASASKARYYERNAEAIKAAVRARGDSRTPKDPAKLAARRELQRAVINGTVQRGPCRDCGSLETQGHHPDYSKPLAVIWLCSKHHAAEHRKIRHG